MAMDLPRLGPLAADLPELVSAVIEGMGVTDLTGLVPVVVVGPKGGGSSRARVGGGGGACGWRFVVHWVERWSGRGSLLVVVMVADLGHGRRRSLSRRRIQAVAGGRNDPNRRVGAPSCRRRGRRGGGGFGCPLRIGV
jgi:hypothetical protein